MWLTDIPFAHRGLHGQVTGAVENTLSAFRAANNCHHGFELDVLLSKDRCAVVFHDMALKRLTGRAGMLEDFTAAELSEFTVGHSEDTIMTLKNILNGISRDYPVLIEIKGDQRRPAEIAQATFNDICDYRGPRAIMSFDPEIIRWFRDHAPTVMRGLVVTNAGDGTLPERYFSPVIQKTLISSLAADFIAYDINGVPNAATDHCRESNIPVLTWTIRTKEQRQKAAKYCDNIIYEIPD